MNERMPAEVFPPCVFIKEELEERGWSKESLAREMDCSVVRVEEILANKRRVTLMIAHMLSNAFGTGATFWLNIQSAYDSHKGESER